MSLKEKIYRYKSQSASDEFSMYTEVTVAQNEPLLNQTMNRSARELVYNNNVLDEINKLVFKDLNISEYIQGATYNVGDLVWYKDYNGNTYLLRCIKQHNSKVPDTSQIEKGKYTKKGDETLNASGWDNQNKHLTILDYDILDMLSSEASSLVTKHQDDMQMHPLGKVSVDPSSPDYIGSKLLSRDLHNLNPSRPTVFFPQQVTRLKSGVAVITGYQRNFGNIVEYDIILKLASSSVTSHTSLFDDIAPLSANTASFSLFSGISQSSLDYQNNKLYFSSASDMDIFAADGGQASRCGIITQFNRNDYVNTYSAKIAFPKPFANLDYMVFSNQVLSQTISPGTMSPSANDLSFCDKTRQSITMLDITFPDYTKYGEPGYNAKNGGLVANSFHLKAIGQIGA